MVVIRYIVPIFLLMGMTGVSFAKVKVTRGDKATSYHFSVDGVGTEAITLNKRSFTKVSLEGVEDYLAEAGEVGGPRLPVVRMYVNGLESIEVSTAKNKSSIKLPDVISPMQRSAEKRPGVKPEFSFSPSLYKSKKMPFYTVQAAGSIRGTPRQLVTIYPLQLVNDGRELQLTESFSISLNHKRVKQVSKSRPHIAFIVGDQFADSPSLASYMAFKEELGFSTSSHVYGEDLNSIDEVRSQLQGMLANDDMNLRYAVIIGDYEDVPSKRARHMSGYTDHYFRAIDTDSYEDDINGPDIGVGRISVGSETDLAKVVEKYMRYTRGDFSTNSWLGEAAWLATSDRGYYRVAEGSHNHVIDTYASVLGYRGNFPTSDIEGGDKLYAISHRAGGSDVMNALRAGRAFVTYSGHGYTGGWAGPNLTSADVRSLDNPDYVPFVLGFACDTGNYRGTNGIAETWQRHLHGAVLYFGSYDSSYWDEDDILEKRIYDAIFRDGSHVFSDVLNFGLSEVWAHYGGRGRSKYYWESYTTFADPSMTVLLPATR